MVTVGWQHLRCNAKAKLVCIQWGKILLLRYVPHSIGGAIVAGVQQSSDYTAHFNNKGYISIHRSLQKLKFLKIICSYTCNYSTFWLVDFMNFMNFIAFRIKFIKFKPIIKFKKFERHNYALQCFSMREDIIIALRSAFNRWRYRRKG